MQDWQPKEPDDNVLNNLVYGLCKDSQSSSLRPHERFVFNIGLERVLADYILSQPECTVPDDYVVYQSGETVNTSVGEIKSRASLFRTQVIKCHLCSFHTESRVAMDNHLCEPHRYVKVYKCNFCPSQKQFKSETKRDYARHLADVHGRDAHFVHSDKSTIMCSLCDYECTSAEMLTRHSLQSCPFREDNLPIISKSSINYKHVLDNCLTPSELDLLDHEYKFNSRPSRDQDLVDNLNTFSQSLSSASSLQAVQSRQQETDNLNLIRVVKELIDEQQVNERSITFTKTPETKISSKTKIKELIPLLAKPVIESQQVTINLVGEEHKMPDPVLVINPNTPQIFLAGSTPVLPIITSLLPLQINHQPNILIPSPIYSPIEIVPITQVERKRSVSKPSVRKYVHKKPEPEVRRFDRGDIQLSINKIKNILNNQQRQQGTEEFKWFTADRKDSSINLGQSKISQILRLNNKFNQVDQAPKGPVKGRITCMQDHIDILRSNLKIRNILSKNMADSGECVSKDVQVAKRASSEDLTNESSKRQRVELIENCRPGKEITAH